MIKKTKIFILTILTFILFLTLTPPALAQSCPDGAGWLETINIKDGLLIPCDCLTSDNQSESQSLKCGLDDVFQLIINFSQLLLALTGSAALLMFMYGGILWIIAAGNQERIQKGKSALAAAAIGIVIILSAWLIINTLILALTKGEVGTKATIFGSQDWSAER